MIVLRSECYSLNKNKYCRFNVLKATMQNYKHNDKIFQQLRKLDKC